MAIRMALFCSQERRAGVFLEQIHPPDVAAQRVEATMARHLSKLPDRCPALGSRGQEPAAEAVAGEGRCLQADPAGIALTIRDALASANGSLLTLPPKATARNTGPALISAAASQVCTASTGRSL